MEEEEAWEQNQGEVWVGVGGEDAYLMGPCSEAQAQLPADHHGLTETPVLAADGAPALGSSDLHQDLHPALPGVSASC